jgi:hypothetical protein
VSHRESGWAMDNKSPIDSIDVCTQCSIYLDNRFGDGNNHVFSARFMLDVEVEHVMCAFLSG